jgi:crotonobetainyl-CoA:carnitine CoA-transferase CaiB-like acyl-CoA transferase
MAMGGLMSQTGEKDGPPCRLDPDHAYCLTGSNAALATIIAYYYCQVAGEGQHVDVSLAECAMRENYHEIPISWEFSHYNAARDGGRMHRGRFYTRTIWPCQDGHVTWTMYGGNVGAADNENLAKWMEEEDVLGELSGFDWQHVNFDLLTQEDIDRIEECVLRLCEKYPKRELESEAVRRGIRLSAVNDIQELYENNQLAYRNYWKDVEYPELHDTITYPGFLLLSNEMKAEIRSKAPLIGEHNTQIYEDELGLSKDEVLDLKRREVI